MRIADHESLEFRTHLAPVRSLAGMLASVSFDVTGQPLIEPGLPPGFNSAASATKKRTNPTNHHLSASEVKQEHPLNLSISLSGGNENNNDCPSSGERSGKSPSFKSLTGVVN